MKFAGGSAMREMDRYTIENIGIPGQTLMLRAARGAAEAAAGMSCRMGDGFWCFLEAATMAETGLE